MSREEGYDLLRVETHEEWVNHVCECSCSRAGSGMFEDGMLDVSKDDGHRDDSIASLNL